MDENSIHNVKKIIEIISTLRKYNINTEGLDNIEKQLLEQNKKQI